MKSLVLLFVPFLLISCSQIDKLFLYEQNSNNCQTLPKYFISGVVIDEVSKKPVKDCLLFIANSSFYTVTDSIGSFNLQNIPAGNYELIIPLHNLQTVAFPVYLNFNLTNLTFQIPSKEINGATKNIALPNSKDAAPLITLEQIEKSNYKSLSTNEELYDFYRLIIGNKKECYLSNPEDLYINAVANSSSKKIIEYKSKKPLELINAATGYRQIIYLKRSLLIKTGAGYSVLNDAVSLFQEIAPSNFDTSVTNQWKSNREKMFTGSMRHFLISLVNQKLEEEGFTVNYAPYSSKKRRWEKTTSSLFLGPDDEIGNTFEYPYSIYRKGGVEDYEYRLAFNHDLQIIIRNNYLTSTEKYFEDLDKYPVSIINLVKTPSYFNAYGNLYIGTTINLKGYWGVDHFFKKLPIDYLPEALKRNSTQTLQMSSKDYK